MVVNAIFAFEIRAPRRVIVPSASSVGWKPFDASQVCAVAWVGAASSGAMA